MPIKMLFSADGSIVVGGDLSDHRHRWRRRRLLCVRQRRAGPGEQGGGHGLENETSDHAGSSEKEGSTVVQARRS